MRYLGITFALFIQLLRRTRDILAAKNTQHISLCRALADFTPATQQHIVSKQQNQDLISNSPK